MSADPRDIVANSRMGAFQIAAVTMCVLLLALDGFDVLSISFASPGIAAEWGVDRAALGVVLSMELIGMAVGSITIGAAADRIGRRPTIIGCLVIMATGMYFASTSGNVTELSIYRLATGLGIGGVLASVNAMAAEFSNARRRSLAVTFMAAGFPIGAIIGGSIASMLLASFDWRAVFVFGAVATAAFIPLTLLLLPESIEHLAHRRPRRALERINATLKRMGHPTVSELPERETQESVGFAKLFSPQLSRTTILLTASYFAHIMTFYFILKWIPKIVVDMGFAPSLAGSVLVWANVGGVAGAVLLGVLTQFIGVRALVIVAMAASAVMVSVFGLGQADLRELSIIAACVGFCTNAGVVGLYAIFAHAFPADVRAGGTGFVIGTGRGGAALGPIIAGLLFAGGQSLFVVAVVMGMGSVIAGIALLLLRFREPAASSAS